MPPKDDPRSERERVIQDLYQAWCDDFSQSITDDLCGKVWDAALDAAAKHVRMRQLRIDESATQDARIAKELLALKEGR